ncbi:uncharacterized protein C18orf63 homolog [Nothobranchius furzeri]|uniref:Si:ch211-152c8.2 n=1 Tax=Nothobranchius furzeri TaxID=105023 RepID=A0A8C6LYL2_NOTFU
MSREKPKSLFFLGLPELKKLVCVTLSLQDEDDQEPRSKQMKACRALVLLYSDLLACPSLDSFTGIRAVMAIQFFQRGFLQAFAQRNNLQLGCPQAVLPADLQCCLSYSLITRLSPRWNKAGLYLIAGTDFLTERGRFNAISMEMSTSEGRLCLSLETNRVYLPPITLEDFELPPIVLRRFYSDSDSVINPSSTGRAIWCHVLPSMKKGQIVSISRQLPRDGPFKSYVDLQNHWNRLYGYRLPDLAEGQVVYCSVYFRPLGQKLFTYPLSCVRLQPVQLCARVDLQGALGSFLSDIRDRLQTVCGFPARLTSNPRYTTVNLNTTATIQVLNSEQINLVSSIFIRPILTQLPAPPPLPQPPSTSSDSQPSSRTPLLLQKNSENLLRSSQTDLFSSSFSTSSPFQPASSLSVPPPSQIPPIPPPMVPIFRNKNPSHHINVARLRVLNQEQQGRRRQGERGRITLPVFGRESPSSSSAASRPLPPPIIPRFSRPNPSRSTSGGPQPRITYVSSLSPVSKVKPDIIAPPKLEIRPKTKPTRKVDPGGNTETGSSLPLAADASNEDPFISSKKKEHKSRKPRAVVQDVDIERLAQNRQLWKVNSASLLLFLRRRGVPVGAKERKEELMMKVMSCLVEA